MYGYVGKILRVNLTTRKISTINTEDYKEWGGGHGMGSAIFWDLCPDKTVDGRDPRNVITIMTSPLSGTLVPAASGRTEVQGIGIQGHPIGWYTRSNFGGRFGAQLKYAGWDGIVLEGRADKPVWIDIRNGNVKIRDGGHLWGLDTWATQEEIWQEVSDGQGFGNWVEIDSWRDRGRTTQRPAVLTIGRVGELQSPLGCLIHDAGNGAGQGGFGGVFGSKNLKAISVIGTGSIDIAHPAMLMNARLWTREKYGFNVEAPAADVGSFNFPAGPGATPYLPPGIGQRPQGCTGCHKMCRGRSAGGGNESHCVDYLFYNNYDAAKHGQITHHLLQAADLVQKAGINVYQMQTGLIWLNHLYQQGILGPGKQIDCDLPFDQLGDYVFVERMVEQIEKQEGIGKYLFKGLAQAAIDLGRYEQDLRSGILPLQEWGYSHHYDARTEVEWGYGSLLGSRDCNDHDFNVCCYWTPSICALFGAEFPVSAAELAAIIAEKCVPYSDPLMADYSDEGIYKEPMAKLVQWHRHYSNYYKQSLLFCDWAYADFVNPYAEGKKGLTGEAEPKFFTAVTGIEQSFEEGIEIGRKIWNLDRAIWALQGRHRDQEVFADYIYEVGAQPGYTTYEIPYVMPVYENGQWQYKALSGRTLDRQKVEDWKTIYYKLEGWDPNTGRPTRRTLEGLGLKEVADELEKNGKLGA